MIKTHTCSRFELKTLEGIRDTSDVILQAQDTGSNFEGGKKAYLCEVVRVADFRNTQTVETLAAELVRAAEDKRRLHIRIDKLERALERAKKEAAK